MQKVTTWKSCARVITIFLLSVSVIAAPAQDSSQSIDAPSPQPVQTAESPFRAREPLKPESYLKNPFVVYRPRRLKPPSLANTARIDHLMNDGRLYLSINDAVALALENNLDLAIARLNPEIADTDLWRAEAGSTVSGVDSGVVQNTPGGGVGGLGSLVGSGQGGTSVGAGGAGAGAGGLVGSTLGSGPQISSFDPIIGSSFQLDRLDSPCNTPYCATTQSTLTGNVTYTQSFHSGTDLSVNFSNNRVSSNSVYDYYNPALNSSFQLKLNQHLLQGFGVATNTRYIQIARNNLQISDQAFLNQIVTTVDQIENLYWDLVYAYEDVKVRRTQMEYAEKTLSNNRQQMEIGSLAAIEVVRAQSTIATDQQALTLSLTNFELAQLLMKNAITRSLADPVLAEAEVIPTSTIELPDHDATATAEQLIQEAFEHRPDLAETRINLKNTQISKKAIDNALLPTLDLSVYYGGSALGGRQSSSYICVTSPSVCGDQSLLPTNPVISYGSTLDQLLTANSPEKGVMLNLMVPIRNRVAQATQVRSDLESQQAQLHLLQLENQVRIEVRNALFGVQQNRASVDAAQAAVTLAKQSLDAEQQKFEIRASTSVLVLQNIAALTQAEATLISAKVAYEKAQVELDRSIGLMLDHAGIRIADAQKGEVNKMPAVPNIRPDPMSRLPVPEPPGTPSQP